MFANPDWEATAHWRRLDCSSDGLSPDDAQLLEIHIVIFKVLV
jgi:hypothetical protein